MFALGFPEILIIAAASVALAFEIAMFASMVGNKTLGISAKIIWSFGFIFFQFFAAVYYYSANYRGRYSLERFHRNAL